MQQVKNRPSFHFFSWTCKYFCFAKLKELIRVDTIKLSIMEPTRSTFIITKLIWFSEYWGIKPDTWTVSVKSNNRKWIAGIFRVSVLFRLSNDYKFTMNRLALIGQTVLMLNGEKLYCFVFSLRSDREENWESLFVEREEGFSVSGRFNNIYSICTLISSL